MSAPIDFYFDFSSPYGYLAAEQIDALGARHGRDVVWRPILLGVVFQQTGGQPLLNIPLKGGYARHDLARSARLLGLPFKLPDSFPFMSVAACRAYYRPWPWPRRSTARLSARAAASIRANRCCAWPRTPVWATAPKWPPPSTTPR
jgi:2-hydroxychromene-2-carboxylate isomerase